MTEASLEAYPIALGIGSNLPNRAEHLDTAVERLSSVIADLKESRRFETLPRYRENQPKFLNSVVIGSTRIALRELLEFIHDIEAERGRNRSASGWMGPRPLDIDILLAGERVIDEPDLKIPHPLMYERKFVLLPLLELMPGAIDPRTGVPFHHFFTKLGDQGIYYYSLDGFSYIWT